MKNLTNKLLAGVLSAAKNGAEYDIVLEYPSLKIIKEQRDY